jgi:hypothetical protein
LQKCEGLNEKIGFLVGVWYWSSSFWFLSLSVYYISSLDLSAFLGPKECGFFKVWHLSLSIFLLVAPFCYHLLFGMVVWCISLITSSAFPFLSCFSSFFLVLGMISWSYLFFVTWSFIWLNLWATRLFAWKYSFFVLFNTIKKIVFKFIFMMRGHAIDNLTCILLYNIVRMRSCPFGGF